MNMGMKLAPETKIYNLIVYGSRQSRRLLAIERYPGLEKEDGRKTKTDAEEAEPMNKFFKGVVLIEDSGLDHEMSE